MDDIWQVWRQRKIDEVLAGSLLDVVAAQGKRPPTDDGQPPSSERSVRVFDGGNWARPIGKYIPTLEKARMEPVDVINARYAERKGLDKNKRRGSKQVVETAE
jgi:tRNA pseudouridine38/39 synthase